MAKSKLLEQVRQEIRRRNYSYKTEQSYTRWIIRFVKYHGTVHPKNMGDAEVEQFLNHLANDQNVAAGTQNQALSALLFLYKEVLGRESLDLKNLTRAKKPKRLPVVLSVEEVSAVLKEISGVSTLICNLLYGSGLRISECLRLRVQDIDFDYEQLWVRSGKGLKDRVSLLPQKCIPKLKEQIQKVETIHQKDLSNGYGKVPDHGDVLESYGELAGVPAAMSEEFDQMLQRDDAPDTQWVVDAYLKLAELPAGERPTRTVVGMTWGVDEINERTQPIQDNVLKEMQLDSVLGGTSA